MIKCLSIQTLVLLCSLQAFGQQRFTKSTFTDYFNEIKAATAKNENLWDYDIYAPILFVQPDTREIYANYPDTAQALKKDGSVFTGILPKTVNIANTSIHWNGVHWAMVMLPLPDIKENRLNLLAHELFHRAQSHLGFTSFNTDNNHLDQKEGRISLRLELEALKAAILSGSTEEMKRHLTDATVFRLYRYKIYPAADSTENILELNEGIAEYTGMMMSGRSAQEMQNHFLKELEQFLTNPTFVRSFAYQTIPLYGYLLQKTKYEWNKEITSKTNLTKYFIQAFAIRLPNDLKSTFYQIANQYNGSTIIAEETAREEAIKKLVAEYKDKFIEQPHLEISFQKMNASFDPRNIIPLEDKGTVYPKIRITDNWGILTVTDGALMSPGWDKISVRIPTQFGEINVIGDGWILELNQGFIVQKDSASHNYILGKK